jgi:hypothetical protein
MNPSLVLPRPIKSGGVIVAKGEADGERRETRDTNKQTESTKPFGCQHPLFRVHHKQKQKQKVKNCSQKYIRERGFKNDSVITPLFDHI